MLKNLRDSITKNLENFQMMSAEEIFNNRKNKFLRIGRSKGFIDNLDELSSLKIKKNSINQVVKSKKVLITLIVMKLYLLITSTAFAETNLYGGLKYGQLNLDRSTVDGYDLDNFAPTEFLFYDVFIGYNFNKNFFNYNFIN